jgi:hypothetical protein
LRPKDERNNPVDTDAILSFIKSLANVEMWGCYCKINLVSFASYPQNAKRLNNKWFIQIVRKSDSDFLLGD